jgi:Na+-driven multidrug efflux pump
MNRTMELCLGLFLLGCGCYLALLWGFRWEIFQFLYAGKYTAYAFWPVLLVGLLPVAVGIGAVLGSALRALERPDSVFWAAVASSIVALAAGAPLAAILGVSGALAGLVISFLSTGAVLLFLYNRPSRPPNPA